MLKIQYYFLLCIGIFGLILSTGGSIVYGQDISRDSSSQFGWVNGGFGASSVKGGLGVNSFGVSPGVSFSYQSEKNLISVRYVYNIEFQPIVGLSPDETVWDAGVLYGRIAKVSYGLASISGGIGVVGGVRRGKYLSSSGGWFGTSYYEKLTFLTVGIPVEGQLFWTPLDFWGIGFYGFANLNKEKSFIGALLCIQIGKLR
jgi:hypothetical protein